MTPLPAIVACIALAAGVDQVRVRDLFGGVDDSAVALAPAPGVQRRFDFVELRRIALRLRLPEPEREVCVERPVAPLAPERILEAMRAVLPGARIELLDYTRQPVPEGALEFAPAGLHQAQATALWTGWIRYGGRHRFAVWARVKVSVSAPRVVALSNLPPGRPIDPAALTVETRDEFPTAEASITTVAEAAGMLARRAIRAGTAIRSGWLEPPKAIARGETVQVEVRQGGAVLQIPGQAQASGTVGQTILVLNPMSNKKFPARVEAPGKVSAGGGR